MNTTNNTILVTGGSAGIGLAMARQFSNAGNRVIILGRNAARLEAAQKEIPGITAIQCDVTKPEEVQQLVQRLHAEFPQLNMLINNAGSAYVHNLSSGNGAAAKAAEEMNTNYFSVISLTEQLLPLLKQQETAAIVNVSSIVVLCPARPCYLFRQQSSLACLYTLSLRLALNKTAISKYLN